MFDALIELVTGDKQKPEQETAHQKAPMLASHLEYRSFDEKNHIFYQRRSKGFILELAPLIEADERVNEIIESIISDVLLPGTVFGVHNFASPRIVEKMRGWILPRFKAGSVFKTFARHRAHKLKRGAWESLATDGPFCTRHFRVILAIGAGEGSSISEEDLRSMRESIISSLDSINVTTKSFKPVDLIRYIDEIICPSTGAGDDAPDYNKFDPINEQCVRRDVVTKVKADRLHILAQSLRPNGEEIDGTPQFQDYSPFQFDVRTMSVRQFPDRWAPWDTQKLIGDLFNTKLCLSCPTLQTMAGLITSADVSEKKAGFKFARTTSLADGKSARFLPQLKNQSAEWEFVQQKVREGEKLVRCYYAVTTISPMGQGDSDERTIKAIYKSAGWDLIDESYIQSMGFLSHFPLMMADGLKSDLERMKRFRTLRSSNIAAMAPFHGEYTGGNIPHCLLVGRRGEPQYWSPFQNGAGNHNVAIAGKSGSGKSVFLQELTTALAGVRAKVIVIDDGRSFEHMAKAVGGTFTEFKLSSGMSINPFRMIDAELAEADEDYRVDCMAMLKAIISQMARFENRLNDTERGLIDQAVSAVWDTHKRNGTIDHIIEALKAAEHMFAGDLATALLPFAKSGTYGHFFLGDSNIDLTADLTVFELSDLASREELRSVVLTSIMFVASQSMRRMDRAIPKAFVIDEAWQMLKGGAMADFVESYARTCRKYGASLITATQSMNDYYKSAGSLAALENSDWQVILQQKPETVTDLVKSGRFDMSGSAETLLRSLKRNKIEYSDLYIRGPETETIARLVLDKFSGTLYSSSPDIFHRIEEYVHQGMSMADAIEEVAFPSNKEKAA